MTLQRIVRIALVVGVLAGGFGIKAYLDATRPKPKQKPRTERGELVVVQPVERKNHPIHVEAQGRVVPARELSLQAEVSGRVRKFHENLVQGGRIPEGDVLLRIDPRDYQLAAEAQKAAVDRSRLELEVEKGRKTVAEREVKLLRGGTASELARREPQLRTAMNALVAAESGLERANLLVSKTTLRAPFNAIVLGESVEAGQLVGPGAPLARLAGTDHFWVQVSVPVSDLAWIAIPGINAAEGAGATARITQDVGDARIVRQGRVLRLAGDLDPAGQMARLLVEIDDPLGLERGDEELPPGESGLPMLLGAFVGVELDAGTLEQVVELPRAALRDGSAVYLVGADDELVTRKIDPIWKEEDKVYVKAGLEIGERLIVSRLPTAVPGMKLRVQGEPSAEAGEDDAPAATSSSDGGDAPKSAPRAPQGKAS
ncbi:MAG: efflux RND transporter periplasmic adaptor subunit [Deltaproteobacteria bacterium]|nr:efflux RND transporter periplasmic adaptor subunit [Deltaproteobacteria bacterium]